MTTLWQDVRYGFRTLVRKPGFTAVALLSLALGVGANTTIFSAVNAVLLRPLPYPEPGQLVQVVKDTPPGSQVMIGGGDFVGGHEFLAWKDQSRLCPHLAAYQGRQATLTDVGTAERVPSLDVSAGFFPVLGVQPVLGRSFLPEEDRAGGPPVVMISYGFWQRYCGADPGIIGRPLTINDFPLTVIGVLPASFQFIEPADLYLPIRLERAEETPGGGGVRVTMVKALARLKPGVELEQARAELDGIAKQVNTTIWNAVRRQGTDTVKPADGARAQDRGQRAEDGGGPQPQNLAVGNPGQNVMPSSVIRLPSSESRSPTSAPAPREGRLRAQMQFKGPTKTRPDVFDPAASRIKVIGLHEHMVANARISLLVLLGAVGLVLLIACANIANLLLCRSVQRRKEIAVRSSLGASRWRVVRLLLTESLLLSVSGGLLGLGASFWGVRLLRGFAAGSPHLYDIGIDWRVLLFTLGISVLAGILFGLIPALQATGRDVSQSMKEGSRQVVRGSHHHRLRNGLQVSEVSMALTLLVGSGLLLKSFYLLLSVNPGFVPEQLLTAQTLLNKSRYTQDQQVRQFTQDLLAQLRALPGVRSASVSSALPLMQGFLMMMDGLRVEGRPDQGDFGHMPVTMISATPDYFQALGVPLRRGRVFTELDRAESEAVAVVNEAFVHHYFPDEDPIGQRIILGQGLTPGSNEGIKIVGVVGNVRQSGYDRDVVAEMYRPFAQQPQPFLNICIRVQGQAMSLASSLRTIVAGIDDKQPVHNIMTMEQRLSDSVAPRRLSALLLGTFAGLALILSAVGIFGVMSYSVQERTFEIGIRMALGAARQDILKTTILRGMRLTLLGLALGGVVALILARYLSSMLFAVQPHDPATLLVVALLLAAVAAIACYLPARRAAKVDPMVALRYE
jgi:predicted permease